MKAIAQQLQGIIDNSGICDWENLAPTQQTQVLQAIAPVITPSCIVYPATQEELAKVVTFAHQNRWGILPCGGGSKLGWGGLVENVNLVVSTQRLNRLIESAVGDLTVTVEAGMKFPELQQILATAGQFLALDPTTPANATIGGIVSTADAGSLRQRYGGVRDQLLGFSFVRADGQIAKAGGRVVKNVAGYDLMKLFTGAFGTLGIISQVTFRVYPLPSASQTVVLTGQADAIGTAARTLLASALKPVAADLLSRQLVSNLGLGGGLGLLVRFQSVPEAVAEQSVRLLAMGQHLGLEGATYQENDEMELWQKLPEQIDVSVQEPAISCKIGVLPSMAVATMTYLETLPIPAVGLIHVGSGLGRLRWDGEGAIAQILALRSHCQTNGGFLTILEAPIAVKQQVDVWGYTGNALDLMRKIKRQFDPEDILSSHRFVAGI